MRFFQSAIPKKRDENQQYDRHLFFTAKCSSRCYCSDNGIPCLTPFKIIEKGNKKKKGEKKHEDIMAEEPGEIYHIRGNRDKQRDDKCLRFCDIPEPVNTINQWDQQGPE